MKTVTKSALLFASIAVLGAVVTPAAYALCQGSRETTNCTAIYNGGASSGTSCLGTAGNDVFICNGACVVSALGGSDVVVGSSSGDKICLGSGPTDTAVAAAGNDTTLGEANNDVIAGGSGNDISNGGGGFALVNVMLGGPGSDVNTGGSFGIGQFGGLDVCSSGDANVNCDVVVVE
jgi:Ca2+-binding RTX toxin-like protein